VTKKEPQIQKKCVWQDQDGRGPGRDVFAKRERVRQRRKKRRHGRRAEQGRKQSGKVFR
jgi:hypothetical protein